MSPQTISIQVKGVERLRQALQKFPERALTFLGYAGLEAAKKVIRERGLQHYPPVQLPRPPYPFKSEKQRRYVLMAIRKGIIQVPYRRGRAATSERYGTQFYTEMRMEGYKAMVTKIGNRASYARWLAGEKEQSPYMRTLGWKTLVEVVREKERELVEIYQRWINKLLKELGL